MILKKNKLLRPNIFHSADKGYKKNRQRYQAVGSYYDYTILLSDMLICSEVLQQAGLFNRNLFDAVALTDNVDAGA